ncbi:MAG TPA: G1 family glutamic endopeptidase [Gaiellales bacterium]|nr:G1 family glutamic endopeptidase [Gaiellales bacterium]
MPRRFAALALFLVFAFAFPAGAGAHSVVRHGAPNHRITRSTSTNWAGYSATGGTFTSVSATWKQPAATCTSATAYSSFWVGLDGDGTNTVEQIGTDADCSGGKAVYYAWYEMYPKFPVNLSLTINPGDTLSAKVTTNANGNFTLSIKDTTTGGSFTTTQRLRRAKLGSAEVIAEAPSSGGVLPLANFGTVGFSAATVNGQQIGSFNPDRIDMVSGTTTKATTSALSGGTAFSVKWNHA